MAGDDDKPATKGDVREAIQRLEETMRAEIRELAVGVPRVMKAMIADETRNVKAMIADETRNALAIQREEFQSWARAFDDRSQGQNAAVERDLAEHKIDFTLHKRPPSRKPARKTSARRAK